MPTPVEAPHPEADAPAGLRLSLPLSAGAVSDVIDLEPAHCERLFRSAAYVSRRDGCLPPGERLVARLVAGRVHARHGAVYCLESCAVELLGEAGQLVARVDFPRTTFAAFAVARATHLLVASGAQVDEQQVLYALHATESAEIPFPVLVPDFPLLSVDGLAADADACGRPEDDWIATFMSRAVVAGFEELAALSRATGVEAAARIHTRTGFDAEHGCFVRILERLVIARNTRATSLSVVSTGASWADFLADAADGPQAPASVHTHLHLIEDGVGVQQGTGDRPLAGDDALRTSDPPGISIPDIVTHYTAYPDPLSAAVIVSVFPERHVVTLYGYGPGALLRKQAGYWLLPQRT
jgi:hypothetical protein